MTSSIYLMVRYPDGEITGLAVRSDRHDAVRPTLGQVDTATAMWGWEADTYVEAESYDAAQEAARAVFEAALERKTA